jgi:hypothetical protein
MAGRGQIDPVPIALALCRRARHRGLAPLNGAASAAFRLRHFSFLRVFVLSGQRGFRVETTPTEKVKKLKRKAPPVEQDLMPGRISERIKASCFHAYMNDGEIFVGNAAALKAARQRGLFPNAP